MSYFSITPCTSSPSSQKNKRPFFCLLTFDGEDSAGADSGLLRGGTGGGTGASSEVFVKFMDETEADPKEHQKNPIDNDELLVQYCCQ